MNPFQHLKHDRELSLRGLLRVAMTALSLACASVCNAQPPELASKIYRDVAPSVFVISICDSTGARIAFGTGFLIGKNKLATNAHVVEGGDVFLEQGSMRIPATVEKLDPVNDIAIIQVAVQISATPLVFSGKAVIPGENVFVLGNPEGLDKTISTGVVSGLRDVSGRKLIQITAPISHGSSGGPVLDSAGEVVGITAAMLKDGQNLNFAVPSEKVRELLSNKRSSSADLASLFREINELQTALAQEQYSAEASSGYQKTLQQIDSRFKAAFESAGSDPDALLKIAEEARDKDTEVLATAAERSAHLKPSARSYFLLGESWRNKAMFLQGGAERDDVLQRADQAFRSGIKLTGAPTSELYYDWADVLEDRNMTREADTAFRRALEISKKAGESGIAVDSIRGLVRTSYALSKQEESDSWFVELVNTGVTNSYDWQAEGARLLDRKKYKAAGEAFEKAASLKGDWKNLCRAANAYWGVADDTALSTARSCISSGTGKDKSEATLATAHNVISNILNERGVYSEALSHAREAVELDSTDPWYFEAEADALFQLRQFHEAITASEQAIRLSDGKYGSMHFRLGNSYFELGNWQFARQSFEKAAELEPASTAAAYNVALCLEQLGYSSDSVRWYREVLRRDPQYKDRANITRRIAELGF